MEDIAIKVDHVSKTFKLPHEKNTSIKSALISALRGGQRSFERQEVLKDVSFEVKKGEFFGIVGRNGSGKSTLLKMLAGIYTPSKGQLHVNGKLTPFIELGVGFNPELTGRENVYLNGALLGFNRKEMDVMYNDIVTFAELEKFMDQKLKNYSSGMQVRLAFSIATRVDTGILLIDEVLAVGDALFQQKCYDYFKELKRRKKTVVFVSHDAGALQQFCDKGILIESGRLIAKGPILDIVNRYHDILHKHEEAQEKAERKADAGEKRWGTQQVQVESMKILSGNKPQTIFTDDDKTLTVEVKFRSKVSCSPPNYGIIIADGAGQQVFASNTNWYKAKTEALQPGYGTTIKWDIPNLFNTGQFTISPAVSDAEGSVIYDWRDNFGKFKVRKKLQTTAIANVPHELEVGRARGGV